MESEEIAGGEPRGDPCPSCGARPLDGRRDCEAMWEELLAETFSNFAFARFHRQIVDVYCLQHPGRYCVSAKSYAAHLTGLCCFVEHGGEAAILSAVQTWLSGNPELDKPPVPAERGSLTLTHVLEVDSPSAVEAAVDEWSRDVWKAYSEQHDAARRWIRAALDRRPPR